MSTQRQSAREGAPVAEAAPPTTSTGPTLVVGLGCFGADILARLRGSGLVADGDHAAADGGAAATTPAEAESAPPGAKVTRFGRLVLLELSPAGSLGDQTDRIIAEAEPLLGLGAAVEATEPGDERRPMLDVLLVANLAEPSVASRLPELLSTAGSRLLHRFSNIFPGHDLPNLTVCPVVALIGVREPDSTIEPQKVLAKLATAASELSFRSGESSPVARVFVVEQQSTRYELSQREVASTVLAFLTLTLGTALRHQEPLRSFLRSSVDQAREQRIFASFGCATLELGLESYCVARAAGELVESMRDAAGAAVGDQAVAAERLVPPADVIQLAIQSPKSGDDLTSLLRAHTPHIDFPTVGWHHTPEQVREVSYGWGWFEALDGAVKAQVERLDEREMDEVTRVADERGLAQLRRLEGDVRKAIRAEERDGPHGWASALRLAEYVRDRADREGEALAADLKKERLPEFPAPTAVESAFRDLREESTLRPRPRRMAFFGVLAAIAIAALLHHLPKWIAVALVGRRVPLLSLSPSSMDEDVGLWRYLLDPPYAFVLVLIVAGAAIALWLHRYRRHRHDRLLAARASLQAAVRRYLTDDTGPSIRRYYECRLDFTLRAWALRAQRRVREVAADEAGRLGAIAAALDRLARQFAAEAERAERVDGAEAGDLVYRTHVSSELLRRSYEATRPGADLVDKLLADAEPPDRDDEPPSYLLEHRLRSLVRPHVQPTESTLADVAGGTVARFVSQLHGKLGVPLEVRGFDERMAEQRYLYAPAWACPAIDQLRDKLATLPTPEVHDDPDRVHLLTVRTALDAKSISLPPPAEGAHRAKPPIPAPAEPQGGKS